MKITEENFIIQLKKRNQRALEYVIDNYAWIIKTVLNKHLYNLKEYYDECMNDCILAIWHNIQYFDPEKSSFKNWVGGIAKHKSIDYMRKYLRDLEELSLEEQVILIEDKAIKEIIENEISEETEKMLSRLSKEDREIFIKLYFENKDLNRVSKDTGLSKPVLYNRISRAKRKIRKEFSIKGGY
jgi:RNA polymerase sigma-70 factor (ECF subfamily)